MGALYSVQGGAAVSGGREQGRTDGWPTAGRLLLCPAFNACWGLLCDAGGGGKRVAEAGRKQGAAPPPTGPANHMESPQGHDLQKQAVAGASTRRARSAQQGGAARATAWIAGTVPSRPVLSRSMWLPPKHHPTAHRRNVA